MDGINTLFIFKFIETKVSCPITVGLPIIVPYKNPPFLLHYMHKFLNLFHGNYDRYYTYEG